MQTIIRRTRDFLSSEAGPTATEYAIMLSLIVIVSLGAITLLGQKADNVFTFVRTSMPEGN